MVLGVVACSLVFAKAGQAQRSRAELPPVVTAMGLDLALPVLEGLRFELAPAARDAFQAYDFRWRNTRGAFELRVELLPERGDTTLAPHVRAGARVLHNARNDEGDFVGRFRGGTDDLERLGAEWAYFWDYAPKSELGAWRRCYQASYYRAGRGLVTMWLLYDDPDYLHSDWVYVLPFVEARAQ